MIRQLGLIASTTLLFSIGLAQSRDALFINTTSYGSSEDMAYEFGIGTPPVRIRDVAWINSIGYRRFQFDESHQDLGERLIATEYRYSTLFRSELNENLSIVAGSTLSFRNANLNLSTAREASFLSGFVSFSRKSRPNPSSKWAFGFAFPDRSTKLPILPGIGYEYQKLGSRYLFQLGFPALTLTYMLSDDTRVGATAFYESNSFRLPNDSNLKTGQRAYLAADRIMVAAFLRQRLAKILFGNLRAGYTAYNSVKFESSDFDEVERIYKDTGLFVQLGLGASFN